MKKIIMIIGASCAVFVVGGISAMSMGSLRSVLETVPKQVTIIGTGYVGLVSGCVFADVGYEVVCADIDERKIASLKRGELPIVEKGLLRLLQKNSNEGRLTFTTDVANAITNADIIFIAVGTPMGDDGRADLRALRAVVDTIGEHSQGTSLVCIKSTVPIGTARLVRSLLAEHEHSDRSFEVVSNPEFLREGSALEDFLTRNPIVTGCASRQTHVLMRAFYEPFIARGLTYLSCNNVTAETIKYAWNAYSATRIAYINQLSQLCNAVGADVFTVIAGASLSDELLPTKRIKPGPGYGGSCLPKDTNALVKIAQQQDIDLGIVRAVIAANQQQKQYVVNQLYELLGGMVTNKKIAILGLTFKQDTDDIRYSPAITAIEQLLQDGAKVHAYDPAGMKHMQALFPQVQYGSSSQEVIRDADALLLLTPWEEFAQLDLAQVAQLMKERVLVDGRNVWCPQELTKLGFRFANLGRGDSQSHPFRLL